MPRVPSDPPFWDSIDQLIDLAETLPYCLDFLKEDDDGCIDAVANAIWGMKEVLRINEEMANASID